MAHTGDGLQSVGSPKTVVANGAVMTVTFTEMKGRSGTLLLPLGLPLGLAVVPLGLGRKRSTQ